MKKTLMLAVAAAGIGFAAFATDYEWTGNANDGKWTTVGNWKLYNTSTAASDYPQTTDDRARFTSSATVSVDTGDKLVVGLIAVHENAGTVTLNGTEGAFLDLNKSAAANGSSFMVLKGGKLVVNLPVETAARIDKWQSGDIEFTANVTSTATSNPFVLDNGKVTLSGTAALSAVNGAASVGNYTNGDTATLELRDSSSLTAKDITTGISGNTASAAGHIIQNGDGTEVTVTGGLGLSTAAGPHAKPSVYELNAGTLIVGGTLTIGSRDKAQYVQTGGTSTVAAVTLGSGSSASLRGGVMRSATAPSIANGCTFELDGGMLALSSGSHKWNALLANYQVSAGSTLGISGAASLSLESECSTYDMGLEISDSATVTVASGARVSAPVGSTTPWKVTIDDGATLKLNEATARLAVPLDLVVNGSGKIQMYSASGTFGNRHAGAVIAHRLVVNGVEQAKGRYNGNASFLDAGSVIPTRASIIVPYIWTGAGADDNWNTAANWEGGAVPPSGSPVDISRATTITLNSDVTVSCLVAIPNGPARKTTVTGSGSISAGSDSDSLACCVFVPEGCELVLDVDFKRTSNNSMSLVGGGRLTLKKAAPANISTGSLSPLMLLDGQMAFSGVKNLVTYPVGGPRVFINHNASTPYAFGEIIIEDGTEISGIERLSEGYTGYTCSVALRQTGGSIACKDFWIQNINSITSDGDKIRYLLEGGSLTVTTEIKLGNTGQISTGGSASRPGGSFEMSGGTLTCGGFIGGCNQNYVRLYGGDVYLLGNMTTNAIPSDKIGEFSYNPITYYLGGVTIHQAGTAYRQVAGGNIYLTGKNGDPVFHMDSQNLAITSGTVEGPGGFVVTGDNSRTFTARGTYTNTGTIRLTGGAKLDVHTATLNGPTRLVVDHPQSVMDIYSASSSTPCNILKDPDTIILAAASCLKLNAHSITVKRLVVGSADYAPGTYSLFGGTVTVAARSSSWLDGTVGDLSYLADGTTTTVDSATTLSSLAYDPATAGATNTLAGAVLTFADGANIHVEKGATLIIDNDVVFAGKITKTGWGEVVFNGAVTSAVTPAADTDNYWLTVREGGATFDNIVEGVRIMTCGVIDDANGTPVVTLKEHCTVSNYGIVLTAWNAESATACCGETHQEGATVDYSTTIFDDLVNDRSNWALTQPRVGGYGRYVLESGELRGHDNFHLSFVMSSNGSLGGTFEFIQNGGTFILPKDWMFARVTSGVKFTYTLNDGRFEFGGCLAGYADPSLNIINLNGGTWAAGKSDVIKREAFTLTTSGEVTFEVASGNTLTIADDSRSAAALVKTGAGSLVLDGAIALNGLDVQAGSVTLTGKMLPFADGEAALSLARGVSLMLDYAGQMQFKTLTAGGIEYASGVYSASKGSYRVKRLLAGTGELNVLAGYGVGGVILIR